MPRMSSIDKAEWDLFLGINGRRQYNKLCRRCIHDCKQSHKVTIYECRRYESKRARVLCRLASRQGSGRLGV